MHSNFTSIQLGQDRFAKAIDLSEQYWAQRSSKGKFRDGEPRFNATASGRSDKEAIHQPVIISDNKGSAPVTGNSGSDRNTRYEYDGESAFVGQQESDPAHPDA